MREFGCDRDVKNVDECVAIEPALAACRDRLAGGIFTVSDESGDAQRFTRELAQLAAAKGVAYRWNMTVESLASEGDAIAGVRCFNDEHRQELLTADAYVMALGSYSPFLLAPLRVPCLVYPAKGYSATIAIEEHRGAPTVSLTDLAWKIVFTRLGDRLRVAGTAELSGYGKELNHVRCEALIRRTFELFPDAGNRRPRSSGPACGRPRLRTCRSSAARVTATCSSTRATVRWDGRWRAGPHARSPISSPDAGLAWNLRSRSSIDALQPAAGPLPPSLFQRYGKFTVQA